MNIVIPMAGRGQRFIDGGYTVPKPLIEVLGSWMLVWALKSLPLELAHRIIFICLEEHLNDWPLREVIESQYGHCNPIIIPVTSVTEGQASTVLLAREHINSSDGLIIHNADTFFRSDLKNSLIANGENVDGMISVFHSTDDRWSFARADDRGRVIEVAEKKPISSWATTGMYYFRHGRDFVSAAQELIRRDERINGEFYVAPAYNILIRAGHNIVLDVADEVWCMGTPEELSTFVEYHATL